MKYVLWTILAIFILVIIYEIFEEFKKHLREKFLYNFYDYDRMYLLLTAVITGSIGFGGFFFVEHNPFYIILATLSVIMLLPVLLSNILDTDVPSGIFVTIMQAIYAVYTAIVVSIIVDNLKNTFLQDYDEHKRT